ncbi:MAG: DUF5915 domain-containing protein, partial [Bacteroidota bacterium]
SVATEGGITVALDTQLSEELLQEGIAREMVNRIQNIRKDSGLEVTDKIALYITKHEAITEAVENNLNYICSETLAGKLELVDSVSNGIEVQIDDQVETEIVIERLN